MTLRDLLESTARRAVHYLETLDDRGVAPTAQALHNLSRLHESFPEHPTDPTEVLALLDEVGSPATVASAGGRFFGFVIGGAVPASLAANWLAAAWDQNGGLIATSPIGAALESVAMAWLLDVLHLPPESGVGFVTCATAANFTALAAARHSVLQQVGWDVESQGLFGAPPITVIVGDEVHVSILKALTLLGLGRDRVIRVPVDDQGRMRADALPAMSGPTIVCIQAGNVNSGAFDPATEIIAKAHASGAWVHVDGAFGLWAAAAPDRAYLTAGYADADSWGTDGHKWLNTPYDCGLVICRDAAALKAAMAASAASSAYLVQTENREPYQYTPDFSRRARGVEVWAALRSLGRSGVADLVERTCRHAARFAEGLTAAGYLVLNEVVINQVMVTFGDAETTHAIIADLQAEGTCWASGSVWHGHSVMRISVSSWATTESDVERSLEAILRVAARYTDGV